MTTRPNQSVRGLRRILGQTQAEWAVMIGASKDTVVSWETGRNGRILTLPPERRSPTRQVLGIVQKRAGSEIGAPQCLRFRGQCRDAPRSLGVDGLELNVHLARGVMPVKSPKIARPILHSRQ